MFWWGIIPPTLYPLWNTRQEGFTDEVKQACFKFHMGIRVVKSSIHHIRYISSGTQYFVISTTNSFDILNVFERETSFLNMRIPRILVHEIDISSLDKHPQNITSYSVAFLSPDPVTIYLSSTEMSQLRTDEDSFDWKSIWIQIR